MPDWSAIKADFLATGMTYPALASKWKVPLSTVKKRAMREKWARSHETVILMAEEAEAKKMEPKRKKRKVPPKQKPKMEPKETAVPFKAKKQMEPQELPVPSEVELVTPEMMAAELRARRAKRLMETTDAMMDRIIDAMEIVKPDDTYALKTLIAALKDLREMQGLNKSALDIEEQKARIAKLRSETRVTETEGAGGVLILPTIDDRLEPPEEEP